MNLLFALVVCHQIRLESDLGLLITDGKKDETSLSGFKKKQSALIFFKGTEVDKQSRNKKKKS